MKRIISSKSILAAFAAMLIMASALFANPTQVSIRVDGLSCPFCAFGLEKKLKAIDGVENLEIKVNDGLAILTFKEGAKIDQELIAKKVKEAGFTPREITMATEDEKEITASNGEKITLAIKGMSCEGCVSRVKNTLEKVECVQDVKVDLENSQATFVCTDSKVEKQKFVQSIIELGFKTELVKQ